MRFNFHTNCFEECDVLPNKTAIVASDRSISWKQLKEETERLSELLRALKIPKGHPVIIYGQKEYLFPVSILSLMTADIPYIPVDRIMPDERLEKIRAISGSQVIINCTERDMRAGFAIHINSAIEAVSGRAPDYSNAPYAQEDPLRYIMFTSGSTGDPKGVQITRSAILSFVGWMKRSFGYSRDTVFMNQASYSFDVSLIETLSTFDLGATLILNPSAVAKKPADFIARLKNNKCSVWVSTPSFVYLYLSEPDFTAEHLPGLKIFLFAGEELPARTVKKLHELFPGSKVFNAYGPTEATVLATLGEITPDILAKYSNSLPIGYSKDDGEIVIENEARNMLEEGEIIIVGDHVSVGYFKNKELSDQKFFIHKDKRAYRTGDFGYCKDNLVFFNGRKDDQVKLHGHRIELNEITQCILKNAQIEDAVTIPLKQGSVVKRIVSFIKLKKETAPFDKVKVGMLALLKENLPEYMIPADFRVLDEFPVNDNHKIDKKKLLELYMNS